MSGRITYRDTKPFCVPVSLDELTGPSMGFVHLPVRLSWAPGDGSFNLDDDGERTTVYQCVIGEGNAQDQRSYLNRDTLTDMWPTLAPTRSAHPSLPTTLSPIPGAQLKHGQGPTL